MLRADYHKRKRGRKRKWREHQSGNRRGPYTLTLLAGPNATLRELSERTGVDAGVLSRLFAGYDVGKVSDGLTISEAIGCDANVLLAVLRDARLRREAKIAETAAAAGGTLRGNAEPASPEQ